MKPQMKPTIIPQTIDFINTDFAAVLFDGFTDEEIAAFERYHIKILDNISRKRSDK